MGPYLILALIAGAAIFLVSRLNGLAEAGESAGSPPLSGYGDGRESGSGQESDFNLGLSWPMGTSPAEPDSDVTAPPPPAEASSRWFDFGSLFSWGSSMPKEMPSTDLIGFSKPDWEKSVILETASRFAIDARLLAALRLAENGGPGREFGVLSVSAPTYQDQANVAARTISNNLGRYRATGKDPIGPDGRVTRDFIDYFSRIYAPVGAGNDPANLNQYHANNISGFYSNINYA